MWTKLRLFYSTRFIAIFFLISNLLLLPGSFFVANTAADVLKIQTTYAQKRIEPLPAPTVTVTKPAILEKFTVSATAVTEPAILEIYNTLFQLSLNSAPGIQIARRSKTQKSSQRYTATAQRYVPSIDVKLSQVRDIYNHGTTSTSENDTSEYDDWNHTDWDINLDLPLFRKPLSVALQIAKTEEKIAENILQITNHELDLTLKELLGNYLVSTYRLFNIRNSIKLSSGHVAKVYRGYELRDQTKLQLLRAQANLKDLETRLDLADQDQETAFRSILDFTGLQENNPIFNKLNQLLMDEIRTAGCINTLSAIEESYKGIRHFFEIKKSQNLFTYFKTNSLLYQKIALEKVEAIDRAKEFTQDEWFDVSFQAQYESQDASIFSGKDSEKSLALVLSVPVFSGGTIISNKATRETAELIASTKEIAEIRAQFHAIENSKKLITSLQNVLAKQQINLEQQQEIVVLSLKSYQIKQTSMQDLLTSQNKLIDIKNGLIETTNRLGHQVRQFAWLIGAPYSMPEKTSGNNKME